MRSAKTMGAVLASAGVLFMGAVAHAAPASLTNPSFEDPPQGEVGFTDYNAGANPNAIPGWTITGGGNAGVFNPGTGQYPGQGATDGSQVAFSNGGNTIAQAVGVLQAQTQYTLQVDLGDRTDTPFPTYQIQLFAGGQVVAQNATSLTPPDGGFVTDTVTFTTGTSHPVLGAAMEIRLISGGVQANFDKVRLDVTAVPEPTGLAVLGVAALGRRRRNR